MRSLIAFPCADATLIGTLDTADGPTGLLIVSGGNEIRYGAHRGMASLAATLAAEGIPIFRFDRRGIGDSTGVNHGYASSGPDIAAALATFRASVPTMRRVIGFGNCDAATALALFGEGLDALILANPWIDAAGDDGLPPPAAIRARYADRLRDPATWLRLVGGRIDLRQMLRGLRKISTKPSEIPPIATALATRLNATTTPTTLILATGDATAQAFAAALKTAPFTDIRASITKIPTASHSFARAPDVTALTNAIRTAILRPAEQN